MLVVFVWSARATEVSASRVVEGRPFMLEYIQNYLRTLNYPAASTVLLVLIALVMLVDFVSSRLRARLV